MDALVQDLRYAIRQLRSAPAFLVAAVATLAIGIGATTAIFSTVNATLLRPLPYPHPEELVDVRSRLIDGRSTTGLLSPLEIGALRQLGVSAGGMTSQTEDATMMTGDGRPVQVVVALVTEGFFRVLGIPLAVGRGFTRDDFLPAGPNAPATLVMSYRLWSEWFARDPAILGRPVHLAGVEQTTIVAGVAAPAMDLPHGTDLWWASRLPPDAIFHVFETIVRRPPGTRLERLRSEGDVALGGLARTYPADSGRRFVMTPLLSSIVGDLASTLLIVLGSTILLLLLGCVNVASLILSRGAARLREIAVRSALGAGRGRLVRQLVTEAVLLACAGAAIGVGLAWAAVRLLLALGASSLPRLDTVPFDLRVLLFVMAAVAASCLIMGLVPAWRLAGADIRALLNESGRTSTPGRRMARVMSSMVVAEVALAIVLVAGTAWLVQSYARLEAIDPGFVAAGRLVVDVRSTGSLTTPDQVRTWSEGVIRNVATLPGIARAGAAATFPFRPDQDTTTGLAIEGEAPLAVPHSAHIRLVSVGFFEAMGIKLVAGRAFTVDDRDATLPVAVVNRAFARALAGARGPIGMRLKWGYPAIDSKTVQVVGIVDDVLYTSLRDKAEPTFYLVDAQAPYPLWRPTIVVTSRAGDPAALVPGIRSALQAFDPHAVVSFALANDILEATLSRQRLGMTLMLIFGATAVTLAAIGIYGVIAYRSAQRGDEIATRIALGASSRRVFWLVMRSGQRLALSGIVLGLAGAFAGGRVVASSVYAMRAGDPLILIAATAVVGVITFLATAVPAARASRLDPVRAMRSE